MRKFFKGLQTASMVAAGMILAQPALVAPFIPAGKQAAVAAALALASGILPSVAPVVMRRLWGRRSGRREVARGQRFQKGRGGCDGFPYAQVLHLWEGSRGSNAPG
jgi:hypothetical protein